MLAQSSFDPSLTGFEDTRVLIFNTIHRSMRITVILIFSSIIGTLAAPLHTATIEDKEKLAERANTEGLFLLETNGKIEFNSSGFANAVQTETEEPIPPFSLLEPTTITRTLLIDPVTVTRTVTITATTSDIITTELPRPVSSSKTPCPSTIDSINSYHWKQPVLFEDVYKAFNITNAAFGGQNVDLVNEIPPQAFAPDPQTQSLKPGEARLPPLFTLKNHVTPPSFGSSVNTKRETFLQVFYPRGSINPGHATRPKGGLGFYSTPLDEDILARAKNVTLAYSMFFPSGFSFVKGGKLPGLYGGHRRCSGGDDAKGCFSTRMMWRKGGIGELYLYVPKDKQHPSLCKTPPKSFCPDPSHSSASASDIYGLSIGRGSFNFNIGGWTRIQQTVVLNTLTGDLTNGEIIIEVDGVEVIRSNRVYYRDAHRGSRGTRPSWVSLLVPRKAQRFLGRARWPWKLPPLLQDPNPPEQQELQDDEVGFGGIFFSTFFGGHDSEWATPSEQYTWFKDFELRVNG